MTCTASSANSILLLVLAAACISATGCTAIDARRTLDPLGLFGPRRPKPPAPGEPGYTIALVSAAGRADSFQVPLTESVTVQEALEQTGTLRTFNRQSIAIERLEPQSQRRHRLTVQFDRGTQTVNPATDYALLPGDRLVVTEDPTTLLDDTLEAISAPMKALR